MKKMWGIIIGVSAFAGGIVCGKYIFSNNGEREYKELRDRMAKFEEYFAITNKWLKIRNQNISVAEYFRKNNFRKIAIYGMGEIGKRLYEELQMEGLSIEYAIDRNAQRLAPTLRMCSLNEPLEPVDVIVVTPMFDYENIETQLKKLTNSLIIPISKVLME